MVGSRSPAGDGAGELWTAACGEPGYPASLTTHLRTDAPAILAGLGHRALLAQPMTGLFCSQRCPGELILKTFDLARGLRAEGQMVIGGFQSPMEKETLQLLLRGSQPLVVCLGRTLQGARLPEAWRAPLAEGRLLVLSPFGPAHRRMTAELAEARNRVVGALAERIVVIYAAPGGKLERACREFVAWGKPVLTLASEANQHLIEGRLALYDALQLNDRVSKVSSDDHTGTNA